MVYSRSTITPIEEQVVSVGRSVAADFHLNLIHRQTQLEVAWKVPANKYANKICFVGPIKYFFQPSEMYRNTLATWFEIVFHVCKVIAHTEIRTDRNKMQTIARTKQIQIRCWDNKQQIYVYDKCDLCIDATCSGHSYNTLEQWQPMKLDSIWLDECVCLWMKEIELVAIFARIQFLLSFACFRLSKPLNSVCVCVCAVCWARMKP